MNRTIGPIAAWVSRSCPAGFVPVLVIATVILLSPHFGLLLAEEAGQAPASQPTGAAGCPHQPGTAPGHSPGTPPGPATGAATPAASPAPPGGDAGLTPRPQSQPAGEGAPPPAEGPGSPGPHPGMHANHRFTDTDAYVRMFEDPKRAEYQKPQEVVAALKLSPGQAAADIGAGSGYFTFPIARALGPKGRVYAGDIEPGMLGYMGERAKRENVDTVTPVLAAADDARLPRDSVDLVFVCNTWHHIAGRVAYLNRLTPALRAGARIAIVDYQKRPLPVGPDVASKLDRVEVINEFREAGFTLLEEPSFLPYQYFLIFGREERK